MKYRLYRLSFPYGIHAGEHNLNESMKLDTEMRALHPETSGEALTLNDRIELNHITFRYPGGDRNIFTDAQLSSHSDSSFVIFERASASASFVSPRMEFSSRPDGFSFSRASDIFDMA